MAANRRGGIPMPANWPQLRAQVLGRDPVCRLQIRCDGAPATQVDHVVPAHLGGTDDLSNLQGVCEQCHDVKTGREAAQARARKYDRRRPTGTHPGLRPDGDGRK